MAIVHDTHVSGASFGDYFRAMVQVTREALERRAVYRATLTELNELSGRELADLGIHRSAIKSIALEAAYGK